MTYIAAQGQSCIDLTLNFFAYSHQFEAHVEASLGLTVLGPLLPLAFMNDLPHHVRSHIRLFADDCLLYRPICDVSDSWLPCREICHPVGHGQRRGVYASILRSAI